MPEEQWEHIQGFPEYLVSNVGRVYNCRTNSVMAESRTLQGDHKVTLSSQGQRVTRSVRVLVAEAFVPLPLSGSGFHQSAIPDTVIVLDNDQEHLASYNLAWRPRWFAHKYARQFKQELPLYYADKPVKNLTTDKLYSSIIGAGITEGLLFNDIFKSAQAGVKVYPIDAIFVFV